MRRSDLIIDVAKIEAYRKIKGYTQEQVAKKIGITRTNYAMKIKRGRFHAEELYILAEIFKTDIGDFFRPAV